MESFAARLASFNAPRATGRQRTSDAKGSRQVKWPHTKPTTFELAQAGLHFSPTPSCPDNVTCYLCKCNIDGWESTDDPIQEHHTLSPSCGWAIVAGVERDVEMGQASSDDPMADVLLKARLMTFSTLWPHENKRGWLCRARKMAEAGWHYCPTFESDDFVRCAYCSLSLDGWEPKDNPFDEHQRRSPDCFIFRFNAPSTTKTRKPRMSKASRLSIVSVVTDTSLNTTDQSLETNDRVSTGAEADSFKPRALSPVIKNIKKPRNVKKSKAQNDSSLLSNSYLEPEDDDFSVKIETTSNVRKASRKRKSDQLHDQSTSTVPPDASPSQPLPKRRTTRSRQSTLAAAPLAVDMPESKIATKTSSTMRKSQNPTSRARADSSRLRSSISQHADNIEGVRSPNAGVISEAQITRALEMDLDRPLTDEETDCEPVTKASRPGRRLTRSKPESRKISVANPRTRRTRASTLIGDEMIINSTSDPVHANASIETLDLGVSKVPAVVPHEVIEMEPLVKTKKSSKKKATTKKNAKLQPKSKESRSEIIEVQQDVGNHNAEPGTGTARKVRLSVMRGDDANGASHDVPLVVETEEDTQIPNKDEIDNSGDEIDTLSAPREAPSKGSRKATAHHTKAKGRIVKNIKKHKQSGSKEIEEQEAREAPLQVVKGNMTEDIDELNLDQAEPIVVKIVKLPTKETKLAKNKKNCVDKKSTSHDSVVREHKMENAATSPASHATPPKPPSPQQSSDAENQPPSSHPSTAKQSFVHASSPATTKIPVSEAFSTPTRTLKQNSIGGLVSDMPWIAADLERVFGASHDENAANLALIVQKDLTEEEQNMTVEQWIKWNARRGEGMLRDECERIVGILEAEGMKALRTLEGLACTT